MTCSGTGALFSTARFAAFHDLIVDTMWTLDRDACIDLSSVLDAVKTRPSVTSTSVDLHLENTTFWRLVLAMKQTVAESLAWSASRRWHQGLAT